MVRQGGHVQLEQSDKRLALKMVKMAIAGFLHAAMMETQQLLKKPRTEVREEKKQGVEFPGYQKVKAAIKDTRQWFTKIMQLAAFHATMVQ
jgi:hypothetical protein